MRHFLVPMLAACLWLTPSCGKAQDGGKKPQGAAIAVIDFGYVDTSGEERDQRKEHETRLGNFMRALRDDLAKGGSFGLVTPACGPKPCSLAEVEAIDARTGRVMFDKLFTFRGDTDEAWRRAEIFIANEIAEVSSQPVSR